MPQPQNKVLTLQSNETKRLWNTQNWQDYTRSYGSIAVNSTEKKQNRREF